MSRKGPDPKILAWLAEQPQPDLTDPDNPEWTADDFARAKPPHEVVPVEALTALPNTRLGGRPRAANPKRQVTLRLDSEVLDYFRAKGAGWQTRINEVLADAIHRKRA